MAGGISTADDFAAELKRRRDPLDQASQGPRFHSRNPPGKIAWCTEMARQVPDVFLLERGNYSARQARSILRRRLCCRARRIRSSSRLPPPSHDDRPATGLGQLADAA